MRSRLVSCSLAAFTITACLPLAVRAEGPGIAWRTNLDAAKLEAAQSGRLILLHFTTKTCGPCRALDKTVFSQPQVGPAVEQDYVPVRIDADAQPALARMYDVKRVPTEIITTPDGNPVFSPQIPNAPEPFVAQLQNLATHYRPEGAAVQGALNNASFNPAYAGLPTSQAMTPNPFASSGNTQAVTMPGAATPHQSANSPLQQGGPQTAPQVQANPYMAAAADPARFGQALNVYGDAPRQAPAMQAEMPPQFAQQPGTPGPAYSAALQGAGPTAPSSTVAASPSMPNAAVPSSYGSTTADRAATAPETATAAAAMTGANTPLQGMSAAAPNNAAGYPSTDALLAGGAAGATATAVAAQPAPQKIALPAGSPPLGFEGYCPVTLKTLKRWTPGDGQYGVVHRGRTYLFAGAEQRDQFLADPDAYSPVFAGMDPVLLIDRQESIEGSRKFGYEYGGAFYLFSSRETMQKFAAAPHTYAAGVRQAMNRIDATDGTLRR